MDCPAADHDAVDFGFGEHGGAATGEEGRGFFVRAGCFVGFAAGTFALDDAFEFALEGFFADVDDGGGDEDGGAEHDEEEEEELLEGVEFGEVDGVEAGEGHGADGEEEGVGEGDASWGGGGAPEDDACDEGDADEVDIV